jgi:protein-tyrosine kinase
MSRIYEAIQRADLERNAAPEIEAKKVAEPVILPGIEEPLQVKSGIVLGNIAQHNWKPSLLSLPALANRGAGVEQFRSLRSRIFQLRFQAPLKTILISSGMPGEGKTFVAANLALSLARNSVKSILLIDGDLRRGTLHTLLGAPKAPGLTEYLAGTAELTSIMQRNLSPEITDGAHNASAQCLSNLTFIPAGICGDNSSEAASNHRMEDLITILSPHFDWIVIDSPPVLAVTDAVELARAADGILLVARGASTPFDVARRTQSAFNNSRILGFVLNAVKEAPKNGSYSYYYGAEEATSSDTQRKDMRGPR